MNQETARRLAQIAIGYGAVTNAAAFESFAMRDPRGAASVVTAAALGRGTTSTPTAASGGSGRQDAIPAPTPVAAYPVAWAPAARVAARGVSRKRTTASRPTVGARAVSASAPTTGQRIAAVTAAESARVNAERSRRSDHLDPHALIPASGVHAATQTAAYDAEVRRIAAEQQARLNMYDDRHPAPVVG